MTTNYKKDNTKLQNLFVLLYSFVVRSGATIKERL